MVSHTIACPNHQKISAWLVVVARFLPLLDANRFIQNGQLHRIPLNPQKLMREIEIFPLTRLHSRPLSDVFFSIFHPIKAWKEWRGRLAYKLKRNRNSND